MGTIWALAKHLSVALGLGWVIVVVLVACSGEEPTKTIAPAAATTLIPAPTAASPVAVPTSLPSSYKLLHTWGSDVTRDGQLKLPSGVAVDAAGNVYIADRGNHRIQKFSPEGAFLTKWGSEGRRDGQFAFGGSFGYRTVDPGQAGGIAIDQAGNVYVADDVNGRIQKFSSEGVFLAQWGGQGNGDGQFGSPTGVAVNAAGNVYVADSSNALRRSVDAAGNVSIVDSGNSRIQKFSAEGIFLAKWGSWGNGDGQFEFPMGVAVDGAGHVYVTDRDNFRIQKFSPEGTFLAQWGSEGGGEGQFFLPTAVAVDAAGNVYVTDAITHRIQKFSGSGQFLSQWGSDVSSEGRFNFGLLNLIGVAVDPSGNVYVSDVLNSRIQKFSPEGTFLVAGVAATGPMLAAFLATSAGAGGGAATVGPPPSRLRRSVSANVTRTSPTLTVCPART